MISLEAGIWLLSLNRAYIYVGFWGERSTVLQLSGSTNPRITIARSFKSTLGGCKAFLDSWKRMTKKFDAYYNCLQFPRVNLTWYFSMISPAVGASSRRKAGFSRLNDKLWASHPGSTNRQFGGSSHQCSCNTFQSALLLQKMLSAMIQEWA